MRTLLYILIYWIAGFFSFAWTYDHSPSSDPTGRTVLAVASGITWPIYWFAYGGGSAAFWIIRHDWSPAVCQKVSSDLPVISNGTGGTSLQAVPFACVQHGQSTVCTAK